MTPHLHPRQRVLGATFAAGSAATLAIAACWTAPHLRQVSLETTESVVSAAFVAVVVICCARLSWVCAMAARDILAGTDIPPHEALAPSCPPSDDAPQVTPERQRSVARTRAVSLFLALAALTATGASAATAAPVAVTASSTAPSPDFTPASPSFTPAAPSFTPSTPPSPEAQKGMAGAAHTDATCEPAPAPGWTPPAQAVDADACRLLMPHTQAPRESHHVVLRGQSVWSIAAAHLPPDAATEVVAESVSAWIEANPELRDDPDLIRPGDVLVVPNSAQTGSPR